MGERVFFLPTNISLPFNFYSCHIHFIPILFQNGNFPKSPIQFYTACEKLRTFHQIVREVCLNKKAQRQQLKTIVQFSDAQLDLRNCCFYPGDIVNMFASPCYNSTKKGFDFRVNNHMKLA